MRVLVLMVLLLSLAGCSSATRVVRLETGQGTPLVHTPRSGQEPVRLSQAELRQSLAELARDVRPAARPLQHARRLMFDTSWQEEVYLKWTGQHLEPDSPPAQTRSGGEKPDELTRGYRHWCERRSRRGDCLSLLMNCLSLDAEGRYALAMAIAMDSVWDETREALGQMVNRDAVLATITSAMTMYMMLWVLPEPTSKGLAAVLTAALVAYLGVDTLWTLIGGWVALVQEVDRASTFEALHDAGRRYGQVLGHNTARLFVMLVTAAIGDTAGLVAKAPGLPGYSRAAVQAEAQGGFRLASVGQVETVAASAEGFTLVLAPGAVAMTSQGPGGGPGPTKTGDGAAAERGPRRFSKADRDAAYDESKDATGQARCEYCDEELTRESGKAKSYEADHRQPYSKGGASSSENLAPSCRSCNREKGAKELETDWVPPKDR